MRDRTKKILLRRQTEMDPFKKEKVLVRRKRLIKIKFNKK
jgi:hypothetical protein